MMNHLPLIESAREIEELLAQQFARIKFHHSEEENDYRSQEERLSRLMLDKTLSNDKHLEFARAIIEKSNLYRQNFIAPLEQLTHEIEAKLQGFEQILRADVKYSGGPNVEFSNIERWLSLSRQLYAARVKALQGLVAQTEFNTWVPTKVIANNGGIDITISQEESAQFTEGATRYASLIKESFEENASIGKERDEVTRELFSIGGEQKLSAGTVPDSAGRVTKSAHPLEGKAWFRLVKVIYVLAWVVGIAALGLLTYVTSSFLAFVVGCLLITIILIGLKKLFYYIVLGRITATESPGTGYVDLDDLRADLGGVRADNPEVYEEVVVPYFQAWQKRYGRRVPVNEIKEFMQRVEHEMDVAKGKVQQIVNEAAQKGATISLSDLRTNLQQTAATYSGDDRMEYIQEIERFLVSLESKYGSTIPVDEASKILDRLEADIRARKGEKRGSG